MTASDDKFRPAGVETARIVNVNIADWTVDVFCEHAGKRYRDVQVMSPYLHYMNGECMSIMPEVGAICWVCVPSEGSNAEEFVLGFQSVMQGRGDYSGGRPALNPGDMMMRTRDENFIILRRGGIVQIGATPTSQRMYVPVRNFIRDFAENYELLSFGGSMQWLVGEDRSENAQGNDKTTFSLLVKEKANDPGHVVDLTIGSHGEDTATTLSIVSRESGAKDAAVKATMSISRDGSVSWALEKDWLMTVQGDHTTEVKGKLSLDVSGDIHQQSRGSSEIIANGNMLLRGDGDTVIKGGASPSNKVDIEAGKINIGGASAVQPAVLGTSLKAFLEVLVNAVDGNPDPVAPLVGASPLPTTSLQGPIGAKVKGLLETITSKTVNVKG